MRTSNFRNLCNPSLLKSGLPNFRNAFVGFQRVKQINFFLFNTKTFRSFGRPPCKVKLLGAFWDLGGTLTFPKIEQTCTNVWAGVLGIGGVTRNNLLTCWQFPAYSLNRSEKTAKNPPNDREDSTIKKIYCEITLYCMQSFQKSTGPESQFAAYSLNWSEKSAKNFEN